MKNFVFTIALVLLPGGSALGDEFLDVSGVFGATVTLAGVHHATTLDTNGLGINFWTDAFEGVPAALVGLSNPHMAGADAAGNVYIADKAGQAILKITTDGLIHTFAGTHVAGFNGDGPDSATNLQIFNPNGLFVFADGTVYLLDPGNHRIRRVHTNGVMTTIVNDPEPRWYPSGRALWVSPDEQLIYYTHEFAPVPPGIIADGAAVKKWTATNGIETVCSQAVGFRNPANIDVNPVDGKLYVTDRAEEDTNKLATGLFRIDAPDQRARLTGNTNQPPAAEGQLALHSFIDGTRGLAFRPDGSYFLAGHRDGNVWFVDTAGAIHKYLRGKGSGDVYAITDGKHPPLVSKDYFSQPRAVTLAPNGDLLVVCSDSGYVFQVSSGPPVIRASPSVPQASFGSNVTLTVSAIAAKGLTYQWLKDATPIEGETNATLQLFNLGATDRATYAATVSNAKGSVISSNVTLAILPVITEQPRALVILAGSLATVSVAAVGVDELTYQWFKAPLVSIAGATHSSFTLSNVVAADAGDYFVRVASALNGSVESDRAALVVAPANTSRPVVAITSPAASFTRVPSNAMNVAGTAFAQAGIKSLLVRSGVDTSAVSATSNRVNWRATFNLVPGTNVLRANITDLLDRTATHAKVVFYATTNALTLAINPPGAGAVRGATNHQGLEVGRGYTLTAVPSAGFVFSNWTGGVAASSTPALTFLMQSNLAISANFVTNPFGPWAGSYNGLYSIPGEVRHDARGFLSALVRPNGSFSGKLRNGLKQFPFTAQFDLEGHSTNLVRRPGNSSVVLELALDLHGGNRLAGRVLDADWTADALAGRKVFSRLNPAPFANQYTLLIPGRTNSSAAPSGHGMGSASIDASGTLRFSGLLADGNPVAQTVPISAGGDWPLYFSIYGGKGSVFGWVSFTNSAQPDLGGTVNWFKPPLAPGKLYTNGFSSDSSLLGSAYAGSGTNRLFNLDIGNFRLGYDDSAASQADAVSFGPGGRVSNAGPDSLTLTSVPSSGRWGGTVMPAGTNVVIPFKGIILQKQGYGAGFHLGPVAPGGVFLGP